MSEARSSARARVVDVGDRRAAELEHEPGVPRRRVAVGRVDTGAPSRAALDAEERFAFEHAECFTQRRARDPEALHELVLRRQRVTFGEFTAHDLSAQLGGHELRGFRDAHRSGDVGRADGVRHRRSCSTGRYLDIVRRHPTSTY